MRARTAKPLLIATVMVALLLGMLMPGGVKAGNWTQVCTASGMTWVQTGTDAPAEPGHLGGTHCPWCVMQPAAALPPPPPVLRLATGLTHAAPLAFWQAPRRLHPWRTAQPRGPPLA